MKIDIKAALDNMLQYFKDSVGDQWAKVEGQVMKDLKATENRLLNTTLEFSTGQLSLEFLKEKTDHEKTILESQAISLGIISASMTQEKINSTMYNVLFVVIKAVKDQIDKNEAKNLDY